MALVLKMSPTGFNTDLLPRPGLCLGVTKTSRVIGLDISVSEARGNHTDLSKPDFLSRLNSKHAKVPSSPISDRLIALASNIKA